MAQENKTTGILKGLLEKDKRRNIVLLLGFAGIALIALSGVFSKNEPEQATPVSEVKSTDRASYAETLEEQLCEMVDAITGEAGSRVLVTMERSAEVIYATEEKRSTETSDKVRSDDTETTHILVKTSDGSQMALPVTELEPVVKGVVVVCPRGEETLTRQRIIDALTTALNISSTRVCVLQAN